MRGRVTPLLTAALISGVGCGPHPSPTSRAWIARDAPRERDSSRESPPRERASSRDRNPRFEALLEGAYGYKSTIARSNTRSLGHVAVPFAKYLIQIHKKLHPVFADAFLSAADRRPPEDQLQDQSLKATVELVIAGEDGHLVQRGVVANSGVTVFDLAALHAIDLAAPYGSAPVDIQSPDGNVYLRWELRRDRMACSPIGMHPYLLKAAP